MKIESQAVASPSTVCAVGDTHGHLQLALCMAARWQRELSARFEAVLLCGDIGSFTDESQLDSATRRHAKSNPCELEFLHQWSADPAPPWLARIFASEGRGGLGLDCPVIAVHGNHEGFAHLQSVVPATPPSGHVLPCDLPTLDTGGWLRYLPSGWTCRLSGGLLVGGIGGIERGQRQAKYHELAYLDDEAVLRILEGPSLDVLLTHQGPSQTQGDECGSAALQMILDAQVARVWFHGHSTANSTIANAGPDMATVVVPLGDVAFPGRGPEADDPGIDGWCCAGLGGTLDLARCRPDFWRDYRRRKWKSAAHGLLVCPDLAE